jgi:type I restriction enzyme R subunit
MRYLPHQASTTPSTITSCSRKCKPRGGPRTPTSNRSKSPPSFHRLPTATPTCASCRRICPRDELRSFRGVYLETAQRLREQREKPGGSDNPAVDQLDFEFVLFASATIDYDYIMNLIARFTGQDPKKLKMTREQLIGLIESDAKFLDEREEIADYVRSLETGKPLDENQVRAGYQRFKAEKQARELADLAEKHELPTERLTDFVDGILERMTFDGEQLTDLMEPLDLGWRERREKELALMDDLVPLLKKRAGGRTISGLSAYEQ